jgi:hypothetical protein
LANASFYWVFSVSLGLATLGAIIVARFEYWEARPNELLHHQGLWGGLDRFSAPGVRIDSATCRTPQTSSGLSMTRQTARTDMSAWRSIPTWRAISGEQLTVARTEIIVRYPGTAQTTIEAEVGKSPEQKPPQTPLPDTWELL